MGLVTNVYWSCPGCGSAETAQVYGDWDDPDSFPLEAIPVSRGLKWNPPCQKCGRFKLTLPEVYAEGVVVSVDD